jgi:hypothetical protein
MLLTALDTASLIRTVLDPERYARVIRSQALTELVDAAETLLEELAPPSREVEPADEQDAARWRKRAAAAADRLAAAGLHLRADLDAGADDYVAIRAGWNPRVRALAAATLYDWEEVASTAGA